MKQDKYTPKLMYAIRLKPEVSKKEWAEIMGVSISKMYQITTSKRNTRCKVKIEEIQRICDHFKWDSVWVKNSFPYPSINGEPILAPHGIKEDDTIGSRCDRAIKAVAKKNNMTKEEVLNTMNFSLKRFNKLYGGDMTHFVEFANKITDKGIDYAFLTVKSDTPFYRGHISRSISDMAKEINRQANIIQEMKQDISIIKTMLKKGR